LGGGLGRGDMTKVPLTIYDNRGNRTVIGSCDVEGDEKKGWTISGIIEDERYESILEMKYNPDWYSIGYIPEEGAFEAAYVPKPSIPDGRVRFTSHVTLDMINTATHPSNLKEGK
jgi:hypothetical protein